MPSPLAEAHQRQVSAAAARTALLTRAVWNRVDRDSIGPSWLRALPLVVQIVSQQQQEVAGSVNPYLQRLLGDIRTAGDVKASALAGVAPDGRPLSSLLMYPAWSALSAVTRGLPVAHAMAAGSSLLELLARTVVADTARQANAVGMAARPDITSYIRVVHAPACARCIVLAGREYPFKADFLRHPRCDCTQEPVTRHHKPEISDPQDVFNSMSTEQRKATFGVGATHAIHQGADVAQVVNARRGVSTVAGNRLTTEGTTKRGIAGKRLQGETRLMPFQIMRMASSRAEAIALLMKHGYIV